jgi:hypothetical protein
MIELAFQTPPAFHVHPFDADPSPAKRGRWASYLAVAILVALLLNVGLALRARSASRSADTGVISALSDWIADLDNPEL